MLYTFPELFVGLPIIDPDELDDAAHYNTRRPHRTRQLRPSQAATPAPEPAHGGIRRRPILRGLINEYQAAA